MRINQNAFIRRNILYVGFVALSVFAFQVNAQPIEQYYPAGRNAFDAMSRMASGSNTTYGMHLTGPGVVGGIPVTNPNLSGWQPAGNYGMPGAAKGPTVSIGGKFDAMMNGKAVPMTATASMTKAGILLGVGKLLPIIGNAIMIGQLLDGMKPAMDEAEVQKNTVNGQVDKDKPFAWQEFKDGYFYQCGRGSNFTSYSTACADMAEYLHSLAPAYTYTVGSLQDGACKLEAYWYGGRSPGDDRTFGCTKIVNPNAEVEFKTGNWEQVRHKFESADFDLQPLVKAQLDAMERAKKNGIDGGSWSIPVSIPTVTGPAFAPEVVKTDTRTWSEKGPDGITREKTETKKTTTRTPLTYDKDTVKAVPTDTTETTTTTKNPDGSTETDTKTETKTEETNKPPEEKSDFCKENPGVLACAKPELDIPEDEIPKTTKDISYQEESIWGSGSCPADKIMTTHNGQTLKVWDFAKTCEMINWAVGPIVLVIGAYTAFIILALGKSDL